MNGELIQMAYLAAVVVYIVDVSGWTATWKRWLGRWLNVTVGSCKPFDCSLCMVHHVCCIYALCVDVFSLPVWAYICALSALAKPFGQLCHALLYVAATAVETINRTTDKFYKR